VTRAFVAVRPPDNVLDEVATLAASLDLGDARRTAREQWHLTLQFLGNRADIDAVAGALRGLDVPAGMARLGGLGAFPSAKRARVVWLGLVEGDELFAVLAREIGERLTPLGHVPEERAYHAHLTLARLKTPADVRPTLEADAGGVGEAWPVDEVTVYESQLRRTGAEYLPRAAVALGSPG
jgi:RNA 2',3'-cyclic 3'-phosphodiesterase